MACNRKPELEDKLKRFLDIVPSRRSDSRDSDELAERIDILLREYKVPKQMPEPEPPIPEPPTPEMGRRRSQSLQNQRMPPIKRNAQSINLKLINQIKLMIKPPEQLVLLSAALVQLFGGCLQSICSSPFQINHVPSWPEVKSCLQSPLELLQAINEFPSLLKDGRLKKENLIVSMYLLNQVSSRSISGILQKKKQRIAFDQQIQSIFESLHECLNNLHAQSRSHYHVAAEVPPNATTIIRDGKRRENAHLRQHHSSSRSLSQSRTPSSSVTKKLFETQTRKNLKQASSILQTPKVARTIAGSDSKKKLSTSRSQSRSLPKYYDLQKRVQMANNKKLARIDRILQLQVKKPVVESQVKQIREGRQSHRTSRLLSNDPCLSECAQQKIALQEEVALNQAAIRALKHEELEIKWQVEREAKLIKNEQERLSLQDQIKRNQREHELLEQQRIHNKLQKLREQKRRTSESLVKRQQLDSKENYLDRSQVSLRDSQQLQELQSNFRHSQKQKELLETSLHKIITNINHHGLSVMNN